MLTVKILGPGCANCQKLELMVYNVLAKMNVEADVIKVADVREIHKVTITTPGLVINDQLVCSGRIPTEAEITTWVTNTLEAA